MKSRIFEFAIIEHPTADEAKKGATSKFLVERRSVLAVDEQRAGILAAREIPVEALGHLDRVEVAIRPF